jgi:hypothetical protein
LRVEPALKDEGGGKLIDFAAGSSARVVAGDLEGGVGLGGGETLVPEVDCEAGAICSGRAFGRLGWDSEGLGFGDESLELVYKAVDALGLAAAVSGKVQRIADDDTGAAVAARKTEDRALIAAGLGSLDGEERLRDAERVGECDTDAARAYIEAEPGLRKDSPGLQLTGKWHSRHPLMIAREGRNAEYNQNSAFIDP